MSETKPTGDNLVVSWIRTNVPVGVGIVVAYLARRWGLVIDEQTQAAGTLLFTGLAISLYYTIARLLERKWPKIGVLLGVAKQPAYSPAPPPEAEPVVVPSAGGTEAVSGPLSASESTPDATTPSDTLDGPRAKIHPLLGRLREFDPRSADHPIRTLVPAFRALPRWSYTWPLATWLDQGQEGACVGFSIAHEAAAKPVAVAADNGLALRLYKRAQQVDQWDGEDYSGTSVLAGMKAAKEMGLISEYRWGHTVEDVCRALASHGPVVFGLDWDEGFFEPDADGFLTPVGNIVGGHAICGVGVRVVFKKGTRASMGRSWTHVDLERSYVVLHNSWGQGWGDNGRAKIRLSVLERLLAAGGECAVPVVRTQPAA